MIDEDTDPGTFMLLVDVAELQCVPHLSYRQRLMLYRQKKMNKIGQMTSYASLFLLSTTFWTKILHILYLLHLFETLNYFADFD